jgi:UDP-4-amino-4,6-dideoxy-N-acetyl-beta-L-altrosamine N-acetyltransferase
MMSLRPVDPSDKDRLLAWRNLPHVRRWMFTDHVISPGEHEQWFERVLTTDSAKYWIIEHNELPVGLVHLAELTDQSSWCSFGIYVADERGRGCGRTALERVIAIAFDIARIEEVRAEVLLDNKVAIALYEGLGMVRTRKIPGRASKEGVPVDAVTYQLARSRWQRSADSAGGASERTGY